MKKVERGLVYVLRLHLITMEFHLITRAFPGLASNTRVLALP